MTEEELIPLSALQHHLFCPRQAALIHVEGIWIEDGATAEGRLLHAKVDAAGSEQRPGRSIARGVLLRSFALGVSGKADVVEFRPDPFPIEYKRGAPKAHRADEVQLCAQAICLEEMLGCVIPEGAIFYGEVRRRAQVAFDDTLRALTARVAREARANILSGRTPPAIWMSDCRRCSLQQACQPQPMQSAPSIAAWLDSELDRT